MILISCTFNLSERGRNLTCGGNTRSRVREKVGKDNYTIIKQLFQLKKLFYLFYFWLCWVFVAARGLSLVATSRGYPLSRCMGFSLQWLLLLQSMGSRRAGFSSCGMQAQQLWLAALERRLSSCGARAQLLRCMWDVPGPRLEPVSPALAGGFLTTAPPGEPFNCLV